MVAALFAIGLLLLVATRPAMKTPVQEPDRERPHLLRDLRDGFVFMLRTPWLLWTLLFASMFVLVVLGPIEVLLPFIAKQRFEDGAQDVRLHPGVLRRRAARSVRWRCRRAGCRVAT